MELWYTFSSWYTERLSQHPVVACFLTNSYQGMFSLNEFDCVGLVWVVVLFGQFTTFAKEGR